MGYLYETHLHTSNSSLCGVTRAKDYIPFFLDRGYDGIFVTDHFFRGNTCIDRSLPWPEWVHQYCDAYREAKEEGDRLGLKVFFGWEYTMRDSADYLIYGLDEDWLLAHPEVIDFDPVTQYEAVHQAGGLVVTAHPFRERTYHAAIRLHPDYTDAWEIGNAGNQPYMDILAKKFAEEHGIHISAGSDIHHAHEERATFGIETEKPLNSVADFMNLIRSGTGYRLNVPEERFQEPPMNPCYPVFVEDGKGNVSVLRNYMPGAPEAFTEPNENNVEPNRLYREEAEKLPDYVYRRKMK